MRKVYTPLDKHTPNICRRDHGCCEPVVRLPHKVGPDETCRCVKADNELDARRQRKSVDDTRKRLDRLLEFAKKLP